MRENPKRVSKNNQGLVRPDLQNPTLRLIIMAVVIVVVLAIILSTVFRRRTPQVSTEAGVAYIHQLEAADVAPVEQQIKDIRQEERRKALENGELDVWQQFGDAVIFGDSRAMGFSVFGFVEDRRVLADSGGTLKNIPDHIEQLQNVNPSIVFFCFGLNDISIGYWNTVEEYITELDSMIDLVKTSVPGVEVYVNSTIPATDPAFEKSEKWREIPDWNAAIKAHCEENGIHYIDISATVEEHKDLYDVDGIHMQKAFYEYWAIDMIAEVNNDDEQETTAE
ncbi:GDSL-type esterase/lipase family protein [Catenibacillus scindens]|uniref:SGNH/GDSL hydrolase family protein n=1 Tax=Catenibacillus scindens TaxID=673271 RepID=UPI00320A4562